ncbi:MAG: carotenoid biosynthesis protein [Verrucomicrobiota bacterium]|nr:carotenoid biosynthesis protein [Verrucomicrobiota bacterium]MDE3067190.1 carotenoid biosynthesis protein [Verrucomicrobiota bacterium]
MPGQPQSASDVHSMPRWLHWLFTILLAANLALVLTAVCLPSRLQVHSEWPEAVLILLAAAATLSALARQLSLQNVVLVAFVTALAGGGVSALGATTGIPFGPFTFGPAIGPQLFKTLPWAVPLVWVVAVLNSRGLARLILRPWRKIRTYGFWLIGVTAGLTGLFDLALDPFASRVKHYWLWTPTPFPLTWCGAPLVNFMAWTVVSLLILAFVTPALINKQPRPKSPPDFHPLGIWLGAVSFFGLAAARRGLWPEAVVDSAIAAATAFFALRGGRW